MNAGYPPPTPQPGSRPMPGPVLPLEVWGATDKGREREGNEDALYPHSGVDTFPFKPSAEHLARRGQILVVADGVGGAQAGAEASRWAVRIAVERYYDLSGPDLGSDLQSAIGIANASLYQYLQSTGAHEAGSTMAAAVIHGNMLYVANVGDSRVYLIRDGVAHQLTRDHTLTQRKIEQGLITVEKAELDPDRNVLTRSLGLAPTVQVDLFPPLQLAAGDVVLLCSDGLPDMVSDAEIARLADGLPKQAARRLIAAANRRGGFDNISVVIARLGGKKPAAGGGGLGNLLPGSRRMTRKQQVILLIGAVLMAITLCLMAVLGWVMYENTQNDRQMPTSVPATTVTTIPATAIVTTTDESIIAPGGVVTSTTPVTGTPIAPTSTLAPTRTPTPSPTQRQRPTDMPIPPTGTPITPTEGGPGEQPPPPPPEQPPQTEKSPPPPPPPDGTPP